MSTINQTALFLATSTEKSAAVNVDGTFHDQLFILSEFKFKKYIFFWSTLMVGVHFTAIFITPGIQTRVFQVVSLECTPLKFVSYKSAICFVQIRNLLSRRLDLA